MQMTFEKQSFYKRVKSMLKVDLRRFFTMPLIYIMAGVCFLLPVLILVMTTMMDNGEGTGEMFTNVWQSIGSVSGTKMSMDLTGMCNINMLYFLIPVLVCVFVSDDFRSGYVKNLFTVRSQKLDYVISKSTVCFVGGTIMIIAYFMGAMLGGSIAGLSFDTGDAASAEIIACMVSKIFVVAVFVSISLLLSVISKQRLWLSILGSFAAGMLLFTMIPMITPLDSSFINVIMCMTGGIIFGVGLGVISNIILQKTSLV